jgi:hypothetical protein
MNKLYLRRGIEMKREMIILGVGLLLLITAFSGCIQENVTAKEITENMLQAIEDVSSYKYSADVNVIQTMINESGTNITESDAIQNGEVDLANKKLKQDNTFTTTGTSDEQHWSIYLIDDIQYTGTESDGNITWESLNTSFTNASMTWIAYSALEGQTMFLENTLIDADVERLSDDVLDGVDCYVLYLSYIENQSGDSYGFDAPSGNSSYELEVTYWIAKDTYLLIKSYQKLTMDMSGWYAFGGGDRSITASEMDVRYYDYNVPVVIELPPEA